MTVHLNWPADVVARLSQEARRKGLSLDAYLLKTVLHQKRPDGDPVTDEERQRVREQSC